MIKSRTYYCNHCEKTIEFKNGNNEICKCGHMFGHKRNDTRREPTINMRNTWSGTTKVEFGTTTIDESLKKMGVK